MRGIDKQKAELREVSSNFLDDLELIRSSINQPNATRAQVRALTTILRRLFLQQSELKRIVDVFLPSFKMSCPNFAPFYKLLDLEGFAGGGGEVFGFELQASALQRGSLPLSPDFDPSERLSLTVKEFLAQKTVFWRNRWFSRKEVIAFSCNKLGGAHTGVCSNRDEKILKDLCHHSKIFLDGEIGTVLFTLPSPELEISPIIRKSGELDLVLFEALSCAHFLVESPKVKELEDAVVSFISQNSR